MTLAFFKKGLYWKVPKAYKIERCLENRDGKDKHQRAREKEAKGPKSENTLTYTDTPLIGLQTPPTSLLFCSQDPKPQEKMSGWTSLGLTAPQKRKGKCFNSASWKYIQWEHPKNKTKPRKDKVESKTINVRRSPIRTIGEVYVSLHFRELWGSEIK